MGNGATPGSGDAPSFDKGWLPDCHCSVSKSEPINPPDHLVQPGQRFATVLLGLPMGGLLSLFHEDGTITTHRTPPDVDLVSRMGRGSLARSEVGEGFRREAALWDEGSAMLLLASRFGGDDSVEADALILSAPLPPEQAGAEPGVGELHLFLTEVAKASTNVGEAVYLSRGGWSAPPNDQYVLFVATPSPSGVLMSHIETYPHPGPGSIWDLFENRRPGEALIVRSPLEAGIDGVGPLLLAAATQFCPPNELALSYIESNS